MLTYLRDTWTIFQRSMILSLRNPAWVIIGLIQPILYLALFGPLLLKMTTLPGFPAGDARHVPVPGLLAQRGALVGFANISKWRERVIDRLMVTPAARSTLILNRVLGDVVVMMVQVFRNQSK